MRFIALALTLGALALGPALLAACTSSQFIGVGTVAEPHEAAVPACTAQGVPVPGMVVAATCNGAALVGWGYAAEAMPVRCAARVRGWSAGIFLAECWPVGPASGAQPK